jgi:hypothetical protein
LVRASVSISAAAMSRTAWVTRRPSA